MTERRASTNRALAVQLLGLVVLMFGFGFLLVPMYDVFCEITGLNGKTAGTAAPLASGEPDATRLIDVEFIASVNENAPWVFRPAVARMQVHPGKLYTTTYYAENRSVSELTGQAVPSVAPGQAARYLQKTECFCFTEQRFAPQEGRDMPVSFMVSSDLPAHIGTLTLSYTFFEREPTARADH